MRRRLFHFCGACKADADRTRTGRGPHDRIKETDGDRTGRGHSRFSQAGREYDYKKDVPSGPKTGGGY
eukprot:gene24900-biopygen20927